MKWDSFFHLSYISRALRVFLEMEEFVFALAFLQKFKTLLSNRFAFETRARFRTRYLHLACSVVTN